MNKKLWISTCLTFFWFLSPLLAQSGLSRNVLLSLQDGERIVTSESCIELSFAANQLYVVAQKGDEVFVYENGQRKGPYKSLDQIRTRNCGDDNNRQCAMYDPEQRNNQAEFLTYSNDGGMVIKLNGKEYGPYKMVTAMHVAEDKSWFVALVLNSEMKASVVSSEQPEQQLEGNAAYLQASQAGKKFLVVIKEGEGLDPEFMKVDFSKMSNDELVKFMQEQAEKKKNAGPPKAYIYSNGGKKFGPYPAQSVSNDNPAFGKTSGNNWYMTIDNALYINGLKVKEFSYDEASLNTCKIWLSVDGNRYALTTYRKLFFSDGSSYASPLKIEAENKGGKTYVKWISLENGKDIVSYSREL